MPFAAALIVMLGGFLSTLLPLLGPALAQLPATSHRFRDALDPNFLPARLMLGLAYLKNGDVTNALTEARRAQKLPSGETWALPQIGFMLATSGRKLEALQILSEMKKLELSPMALARCMGHSEIKIVHSRCSNEDTGNMMVPSSF